MHIELNTVVNMDCLDFLSKTKEKSIDLIIVDPPYNMKKADWDTFKTENDYFEFTFKWLDLALDTLKDTGSIYIFNTPYNNAHILRYLLDKNMKYQNWITWDKKDGFSAGKKRFLRSQETILFFTKSNKYIFNADDVRIPYESKQRIEHATNKGILKNGKRWFPNPLGKLCTDVWHIVSERHKNKVNGKTVTMGHLTPKPLEMIERIIKASSNEGSIILDCFSGIGTTAIASKKLNRSFTCSDINLEYVNISNMRLDNNV